jgi:tetratricopeptide (TPR) repeat protein
MAESVATSLLDVSEPTSASPTTDWRRPLNWCLIAVALVFAFLAASFAIRNADFWRHLATGQLLAQGRSDVLFGKDPFAYTTDGVYWVNHAWGFDLGLYLLHGILGGGGVIAVKAALIALLSLLMLRVGDRGWPAAAFTMLAILAMSPALLVQPAVGSFLLLGAMLWLLTRPGLSRGRFIGLVVICAVWVNIDSWFLLGPLMVGLFWLGDRIQSAWGPAPVVERPQTSAWLFPACLAACLLNPHHVRAFMFPPDLALGPAAEALRDDARFQWLFTSPWQLKHALWAAGTVNLAGWAYVALSLAVVLSFGVCPAAFASWRFPVFLVFGALGAWNSRTMPFFAIVAGPIGARNLSDYFRRPQQTATYIREALAQGWHLSLVTAGIVLGGLAWLGWLQGFTADESHRVAWAVQPDPSLRRLAESISRWRKEGLLRDADRGLALHPDAADYVAWFCPEEKTFLDSRLSLFGAVANEYAEVCRGLGLTNSTPAARRSADDWRRVLRAHGITHILLTDRNPARVGATLERLVENLGVWSLLRIDGQALLLGWKPARSFDGLVLRPERLAFGTRVDATDSLLPAAPGEGPGRGPRENTFWSRVAGARCIPTWESGAAGVYVSYFGASRSFYNHEQGELERAARTAAWIAQHAAPATTFLPRPGWLERSDFPTAGQHGGPPAPALLAVRTARRAVADCPDDGRAWLALGQAYVALGRLTGEPISEFPPLGMMRFTQMTMAFHAALARNPEAESAHRALADLYHERGYLDAELVHRQALARVAREQGAAPGDEDAVDRIALLQKDAEELERRVQDNRQLFVVRTQSMGANPYARAVEALGLGLALEALDGVLMKSQVLLFGPEGARLQLELLLTLGRAEQARELLDDPELRSNRLKLPVYKLAGIGQRKLTGLYLLPAYEWLRACQAAAVGDYDRASAALEAIATQMRGEEAAAAPRLQVEVAHALLTELGASMPRPSLALMPEARNYLVRRTELLAMVLSLPRQRADLSVLTALLELERGDPARAESLLQAALQETPGPFIARPLAQAYLYRIRAARR